LARLGSLWISRANMSGEVALGLFLYLLVGALVMLALKHHVAVYQEKHKTKSFSDDLMKAYRESYPEQSNHAKKTEDKVSWVFALFVWPIVVVIGLMAMYFPNWIARLSQAKDAQHNPEDDFFCKREHIVKLITPEDAERDALIMDPLGRVPQEPFGHLAPGWRAFLAQKKPGFQLWSFKVPGNFPSFQAKNDHGREWSVAQDEKMGFAWVHKGKIKAEFLTQWD